jgi:hypothetical protein
MQSAGGRCFVRDPHGQLIEVGQSSAPFVASADV